VLLTPYERLLLAYVGKQPDRVPFVMGMPRDVPALRRPRESHASVWDRARVKASVEAGAGRARYFYGRWPEAAGTRSVGTGGHGDRSVQYAQLVGPQLGIEVAYTESTRGGYAYTRPLITDLASFDVERLYVPDLTAEPAMARVLDMLAYRLECMDAAYAGLEDHVGRGGWVSTRCVEDVVDQGLLDYNAFLMGLRFYPAKIHALCRLMADYVVATLRAVEDVTGTITKLSIADHVTTFMSRAQAEAFWVPYVRRVTGAFDGAVKVYHNEGRIGHLCGLLGAAGFDAWQVGPEDDLAAVRKVVGRRFGLYGNVDGVVTVGVAGGGGAGVSGGDGGGGAGRGVHPVERWGGAAYRDSGGELPGGVRRLPDLRPLPVRRLVTSPLLLSLDA
jgi:hypothetical protein